MTYSPAPYPVADPSRSAPAVVMIRHIAAETTRWSSSASSHAAMSCASIQRSPDAPKIPAFRHKDRDNHESVWQRSSSSPDPAAERQRQGASIAQLQRFDDLRLRERCVRHAADALDEQAQQLVVGVRVVESCAGLEKQRSRRSARDARGKRDGGIGGLFAGILIAGGHAVELRDRYLAGVRNLREVARETRVRSMLPSSRATLVRLR